MGLDITAWLNMAIRWLHLTAGIAWIGSSFYFMWLDAGLKPGATPTPGIQGELWAVHSGGFYHKRKFLVAPPEMPDELHWFKWEAYTTWISGALLLSLIYYYGASLYLIDASKLALSQWQAIGLGVGFIAGGWLVYDGLCRSPLGRTLPVFGAVWFALLTGAAYVLTRVFSDRGAFIHVGAIIGTVMVANVFLIIIPNQAKVVAAVLAGEAADPKLGKQAKQRSVHNNYMTLPVLLIMISSHYPMVFSNGLNWLLLAGLGASGATIRHFFNLKNAGRLAPEYLGFGVLIFLAVMAASTIDKPSDKAPSGPPPSFAEAQAMIRTHCIMCHSATPTHKGITTAPAGVAYDTPALIHQYAAKILERAVDTTSMPLGNETHMTMQERVQLGAWIRAGAAVPASQ